MQLRAQQAREHSSGDAASLRGPMQSRARHVLPRQASQTALITCIPSLHATSDTRRASACPHSPPDTAPSSPWPLRSGHGRPPTTCGGAQRCARPATTRASAWGSWRWRRRAAARAQAPPRGELRRPAHAPLWQVLLRLLRCSAQAASGAGRDHAAHHQGQGAPDTLRLCCWRKRARACTWQADRPLGHSSPPLPAHRRRAWMPRTRPPQTPAPSTHPPS